MALLDLLRSVLARLIPPPEVPCLVVLELPLERAATSMHFCQPQARGGERAERTLLQECAHSMLRAGPAQASRAGARTSCEKGRPASYLSLPKPQPHCCVRECCICPGLGMCTRTILTLVTWTLQLYWTSC